MKTDVEVRQDVYAVVVASAIKTEINGEVRIIPRATGSKAEDCIISVLEGDNKQIQDCIVNVNIYVPNMTSGGQSVENIPRTKAIAKTCELALKSVFGEGFWISLEKQRIMPVQGKNEYLVNNRIRYKFNNE